MSQVFNQCPKCSVDLPDGASTCACGWRKRGTRAALPARKPVQCAHEGCPTDATLALRMPTGWANLCRGHAECHWQREADEFVQRMGLDTLQKKRQFINDRLAGIGRARPSKEWAESLLDRVVAGERLIPIQYSMMMQALNLKTLPGPDEVRS